jgi:hypothetical protein
MGTQDPMAAVRQYVDCFNKGDAKVMADTFAVPGSWAWTKGTPR